MKLFWFLLILVNLFLSIGIIKSDEQCNSHLITDFSQEDCIEKGFGNTTYFYWIDITKSCLPYCEEYPSDTQGFDGLKCETECPPGYECINRCKSTKDPCEVDKDCPNWVRNRCVKACSRAESPTGAVTCMAYHAATFQYRDTYYTAQKFKPKCTNSGDWKAKQCKGGLSGRCFCFDTYGKRLFGQAKYLESDDMTCTCSRRRADLMAAGKHYVTFHCDNKGNYEELQCDKDSQLCWCAEPTTGELTSAVVPEKVMTKLPCYKVADIGAQYLRKCDSVLYAISYIESKLKIRGMQYVNLGNIQCDGDGAYGAYNLTAQIARCTWRDGKQIGSWQSDVSTDISKLNCNCARDYKMYNHQLTCDGSGNYYALQTVINKDESLFYCVDSDGFPKTDMFTEKVDNCTDYY